MPSTFWTGWSAVGAQRCVPPCTQASVAVDVGARELHRISHRGQAYSALDIDTEWRGVVALVVTTAVAKRHSFLGSGFYGGMAAGGNGAETLTAGGRSSWSTGDDRGWVSALVVGRRGSIMLDTPVSAENSTISTSHV